MNPFQKQLVLGNGRTLYEEAKVPRPDDPLDCSMLDEGVPPPTPIRVSVEEFEATMRAIRRGGTVITDYSILNEGDVVSFTITGNIMQYKGIVLKVNGYQGRPELKVTHFRSNIYEEWKPDTSWDGFRLKGDDFILDEKLSA